MPAELHRPGDERFEELARPATNRYPTSQPQAIARCATPTDVAHMINFARRYGLETAVRGAGHSFADHSSTAGLLIETGLMNTISMHGDLATIGAGARLSEIYSELHNHPAQPGASRQAASQWLSHVRTLLDGYGTGRAYQNFADPELADPLLAYYGDNLPRLRHIKNRYDPDNFFHHRQSIPPTTERHR